jgi:predicted double-glycine peptidase
VIALTAPSLSAQIGIGDRGLRIDPPVRSMKDLRDRNVVKQRFDFSCGAAALATLLHYGFGERVTEGEVLDGLFDLPSDAEKADRRRTGFSLLDLQRVAQARDYMAEGFRLTPAQLSMLDAPVIVFIEPRGYRHFAVLRGIRGDRVYLADPSRGNIRMPAYTFLDSWLQDDGRGIIFAVEPKAAVAQRQMPLMLAGATDAPRPEIMAAREMLTVGNVLIRMPRPAR